MKVISIGMGQNIFDEGLAVRRRMAEYGKIFDELHLVVFTPNKSEFTIQKLSDNVFLYPTKTKIRPFYFFDFLRVVKDVIKEIGVKNVVLTVQDPFETGIVGVLLKLVYKLPLQVQLHTDFANRYFITHSLLNFIRFPLGLFVLSFADSVRVVSDRVAKSVCPLSHNVSILPVYTEVRDTRYEIRKNTESVNFLTVCRLEKEKDLNTAIKAFKNVLDKGIDAKFTVVGDGSQRKNLELLAKRLEIENKIIFVGWQNDLENYYRNADIYVSTSLYEGYGMSIVEAASFGLPLIISDTGVAGSLFNDGKEAFVCKQKNIDAFTKAMSRIASDGDLRSKMGARAKESAQANGINFGEYLQQYKNLLEQASHFHNANHGIFEKNILLRYLIAGITAASTNIGLLYIFTDIFGIWYIYSSVLSFVVAIAISFALQKFWTFADQEMSKVHHQFFRYMGVAISGISINTVTMYLLVDIFNIWYILAQIITGVFIAVLNFLMYKFFIFNK